MPDRNRAGEQLAGMRATAYGSDGYVTLEVATLRCTVRYCFLIARRFFLLGFGLVVGFGLLGWRVLRRLGRLGRLFGW